MLGIIRVVWYVMNSLSLPRITPAHTGGFGPASIQTIGNHYDPDIVLTGLVSGTNVMDDLTVYRTTSKVITPALAQAKYYAHFAAAVYCHDQALSEWNCKDCVATGSDVKFVKELYNETTHTRAIVLKNDLTKEIILAYRGTTSVRNLAQDMVVDMITVHAENENLKVHLGAWNNLMSIYEQVTKTLRSILKNSPDYHITITGHSLGAMLASVSFFKLKTTPEFSNISYSLYTYGQPRTGNLDFAQWMNSQEMVMLRVVSNRDFVPHYTISSAGYVHHLQELWISRQQNIFCSKEMLEDPTCSNSLGPGYGPASHLLYWNIIFPPLDCVARHPLEYLRLVIK